MATRRKRARRIVARMPRRVRHNARKSPGVSSPLLKGFIPLGGSVKRAKKVKKWSRPRVAKVGNIFKHGPRSSFFGRGAVTVNPRRSRRRTRHNPFNVKNTIKQITSKKWLITLGTIGGGFVAGMAGKSLLLNALPANMKQYGKYIGVGHIIIGALLVGMMKKKALKEVGVVVAATGLYDLIASNVPVLALPALPSYVIPGITPKTSIAPALSGSYPVSRLPVSPVAALSGGYSTPAKAGYAGSFYTNQRTEGFAGVDNPYSDIDW